MGGTSQPWMAQQQQPTPDQFTPLQSPPAQSEAPGSTSDLEQRAAQGPQQLGQQLQQQQQSSQQPGSYSQNNPFLPIIQDYQSRAQQTAPQEPRSGVKGLLTNFFSGMGNSMMQEAGL